MFLCKSYPDFSMEELENAFMKACSGEMGDFEHYQNFSPIYLGRIVTGYEELKMQAKRKYMLLEQKKLWEDYEEEKRKKLEANPMKNVFLSIAYHYKYVFLSGKLLEPTDIYKYHLRSTMEYARKYSVFLDYDSEKEMENIYLNRFFVNLPSDKIEAIEKIKHYVRSNWQDIQHAKI